MFILLQVGCGWDFVDVVIDLKIQREKASRGCAVHNHIAACCCFCKSHCLGDRCLKLLIEKCVLISSEVGSCGPRISESIRLSRPKIFSIHSQIHDMNLPVKTTGNTVSYNFLFLRSGVNHSWCYGNDTPIIISWIIWLVSNICIFIATQKHWAVLERGVWTQEQAELERVKKPLLI